MAGNGAGASYGDLLVTSLLVLGAVCIAAYVAVRVFGRLLASGRARGTHLLDVVARVPLEPRRSLYVVEVAGKTLLVGTSEMGLSVLSELDGSEVKSRVRAQQSFGDLVRAAWMRRKERAAGHGDADGQGDAAGQAGTAGLGSTTAVTPTERSGDVADARGAASREATGPTPTSEV
jgi:flagellar protein FliO/FliZ